MTTMSSLGPWADVLRCLVGNRRLRPVQRAALLDARVLESRQHLVVASPTNSGKSLIGHLVLLDAVRRGQRAVLLEPLRALAREQSDSLRGALAEVRSSALPRTPEIHLTTGDFRLDGEQFAAPPPENGQIIVATPERLEAILRSPAHRDWVATIGAVVVDEAHLISDQHRGPTLELVIATLLSQAIPPRIALLSATLGDPEALKAWLSPCQVICSSQRTSLRKEVWELETGEDPDYCIAEDISSLKNDPSMVALVFVYRRESTVTLARKIEELTGVSALPYHSGHTALERERARAAINCSECRVLVTTTALAMGVNLPATHVFVRDTTFFGAGRLEAHELLQILGRAGRGDNPGRGVVLVRATDDWKADELAVALRSEHIPPLQSALAQPGLSTHRATDQKRQDSLLAPSTMVASCLSRMNDEGASTLELRALLGHTLGASAIVPRVEQSLQWLQDPSRALACVTEDGRHRLTVLGRAGVASMMPLPHASGLGQLIRDLLSLDPSGGFLARWAPIDHLLLVALLSDRAPRWRRFSEGLAEQVDAWLESRPLGEKGLLFAEWVMGSSGKSRAAELLGSLAIPVGGGSTSKDDEGRKVAYVAMFNAIVLDERSRGTAVADVQARWGLKTIESAEESWRDTTLWLLGGHLAVCDVRAFYHHLRESCGAQNEQVRDAKRVLRRMRGLAFELMERLRYCSPLGSFLVDLRKSTRRGEAAMVGVGTVRALESRGVRSTLDLAGLDEAALVGLGVQKRFAKQIVAYCRRRMR